MKKRHGKPKRKIPVKRAQKNSCGCSSGLKFEECCGRCALPC